MRPEKPRGRNDSRQGKASNPIHFTARACETPTLHIAISAMNREGDSPACDGDAALDVEKTIENRKTAFDRLECYESNTPSVSRQPRNGWGCWFFLVNRGRRTRKDLRQAEGQKTFIVSHQRAKALTRPVRQIHFQNDSLVRSGETPSQ